MQVIELLSAIAATAAVYAAGVVAIWAVARAMAAVMGTDEGDQRG